MFGGAVQSGAVERRQVLVAFSGGLHSSVLLHLVNMVRLPLSLPRSGMPRRSCGWSTRG